MTTAYSTLLGLALPVQGELSGTWGDTVDNGITRYLDIAVAGTVTLTNDGAVTLSLTNGDASATNIVSSLTGAGSVSAQFAIIRVTGTLTVAKVLTAPSSSRTFVVVNAATGSTVTVKASGQTGVSIAVGEAAFVYFNGTDYAKIVGTATAGAAGGSTTQVQYNNAGVLAGITGATSNGTALTLVAPVLGTPASGTVTNLTGTASININGTVGATTATTGAFTTLSASSDVTLSGGTANGVAYLNGSKVLTTGSALTFDGSYFTAASGTGSFLADILQVSGAPTKVNANGIGLEFRGGSNTSITAYSRVGSAYLPFTLDASANIFSISGSEQMRLTSTGLGIGTSSPGYKLTVAGRISYSGAIGEGADTTLSSSGTSVRLAESATWTSLAMYASGSEGMRLTSTGLGIGTSSPRAKLDVSGSALIGTYQTSTNYPPLGIKTAASVTTPSTFTNAINIWNGTTVGEYSNITFGYNTLGLTNAASYIGFVSTSASGSGKGDLVFGTRDVTTDTAATERMRLDSSGNLGLGVTPSAWLTDVKAFDVNTVGCLWGFQSGANVQTGVTNNAFINSSAQYIYKVGAPASNYLQASGAHQWFTAPSGTAGDVISFTQAMTLDASGNLGVGTTSPALPLDVVSNSGANAISIRGRAADDIGTLGFYTNAGSNIAQIQLRSDEMRLLASGARSQTFYTNGSERMRLDASGNLGLGVTPSAWYSTGYSALQVKGSSIYAQAGNDTNLASNAFVNTSPVWAYVATGTATRYEQTAGKHIWYTAPSWDGTGSDVISFTQAMTLGADGNLAVGTTSTNNARLFSYVSDASLAALSARQDGAGPIQVWNSGGADRARIDSSGNLLVGTTGLPLFGDERAAFVKTGGNGVSAVVDGTSYYAIGCWNKADSGTRTQIGFYDSAAGGFRGSITTNGSATAYNTSSDYRLKTVIGPVANAGQRIDALQPIEYTWNSNGERTRGFLAHQFQEVYAGSVSGTKDAVDAEGKPVYQSMQASTSEVIADLVAEIQSLRKRLAAAGIA